jgi:hypothetical protein
MRWYVHPFLGLLMAFTRPLKGLKKAFNRNLKELDQAFMRTLKGLKQGFNRKVDKTKRAESRKTQKVNAGAKRRLIFALGSRWIFWTQVAHDGVALLRVLASISVAYEMSTYAYWLLSFLYHVLVYCQAACTLFLFVIVLYCHLFICCLLLQERRRSPQPVLAIAQSFVHSSLTD